MTRTGYLMVATSCLVAVSLTTSAGAWVRSGGYGGSAWGGGGTEQVTADQTQCGQWATQQTGYNPTATATAAPATPTPPPKNLGLFGGISRRDERREERWERRDERQEQRGGGQGSTSTAAPNPQQTDAYNRALDACLTARGYTVR